MEEVLIVSLTAYSQMLPSIIIKLTGNIKGLVPNDYKFIIPYVLGVAFMSVGFLVLPDAIALGLMLLNGFLIGYLASIGYDEAKKQTANDPVLIPVQSDYEPTTESGLELTNTAVQE